MDGWLHVQSFESMAVIFIRVDGYSAYDYTICGRARVHLTIINVPTSQYECLQYNNVDMVHWKPLTDTTFTKYQPNDESESESENLGDDGTIEEVDEDES